jgi:hypothetical protein
MTKEDSEFVEFGFTEHVAVRSSLLVSDPTLKVEEPKEEITHVFERITKETLLTIMWKFHSVFSANFTRCTRYQICQEFTWLEMSRAV